MSEQLKPKETRKEYPQNQEVSMNSGAKAVFSLDDKTDYNISSKAFNGCNAVIFAGQNKRERLD